MIKKLSLIFASALVLNSVWENAHSVLYANYMRGAITEPILLRASIWDAVIITLICLPFLYDGSLRRKSWLIFAIGVVVAIAIEMYALQTGRWAYNELMPVIPLLGVGLTPTLQLGTLGIISFIFQNKIFDS